MLYTGESVRPGVCYIWEESVRPGVCYIRGESVRPGVCYIWGRVLDLVCVIYGGEC